MKETHFLLFACVIVPAAHSPASCGVVSGNHYILPPPAWRGLRGGGGEESPEAEGLLRASSLDRVAAYVKSEEPAPSEESEDPQIICEHARAEDQHEQPGGGGHEDVVIRLDADFHPPARAKRVLSWQETHDLDVYEQMLREQPHNADIWSAYGHALLAGHDDATRAMQAYGRAIELVPSHSFALNNLGYILMKYRNDLSTAEGCYRKALSVDPADTNTNVNLAVLLSAHRNPPDYDTAAECYDRALSVDENHIAALVNYANFLVDRPLTALDKQAADAAAAAAPAVFAAAQSAAAAAAALPKSSGERPVLDGGYTWEELHRKRTAEEEAAGDSAVMYMISKLQDWKRAAVFYERALNVQPDSADAMCGFAALKKHEDDVAGAEMLYHRYFSIFTLMEWNAGAGQANAQLVSLV